MVIHHARQSGDAFLTRVVRKGAIALAPLGIEISIAEINGATSG
jgi:hypothetical protein